MKKVRKQKARRPAYPAFNAWIQHWEMVAAYQAAQL